MTTDHSRAREFVELHDQVQTSVTLLDSLESFLSTFRKDLSAVSGQISDLQDRSKDIDNRLKSRRRIEKPLSGLITELTVPPSLSLLILDTDVGENWIGAMEDFERRLETSKARSRVKAARDLGEVAEGLRIVAATKLRVFFLALFQPIRSNVTTNMQVVQTSILLKYAPLFAFLQRQAPGVATEVQRSYVGAARLYYETGFRRYARSLGWVKTRTTEKFTTIASGDEAQLDFDRLENAKIDGPSVTLAYMADDKAHKEPMEALWRSLLLVFMDNATAEYNFIANFFSIAPPLVADDASTSLTSPTPMSPDRATFADNRSDDGGLGVLTPRRVISSSSAVGSTLFAPTPKQEQVNLDAIWKPIFDPVLEYCQTFLRSLLEPLPPVIPLLTMIRLTEAVVSEVQLRNSPPVETFIYTLRLQMWPVFQKAMAEHIDSLKKLVEGSSTGYFSRSSNTTDALVANLCKRYIHIFTAFVSLTAQEEETMIFANLMRLRQELTKIITKHTDQMRDPAAKATLQSSIYDILLRGLSGHTFSAHPKSQQENAYWAHLQEEAKRKLMSTRGPGPR
ncbi:Vps52-domain-containing protein [Pluteus cervinus]|uniref:Vps52-domain-containing protein n=1 Tax=Pluteus cervinus TaxID=181527 RepID=A0ACD3BDU8_9AGAR|nr:Vps52-domain-containing protein [Pluteus cervinus]